MQHSAQATLRATAFIVGILFASAALADSKSTSSNDAAANCANDAAIKFSIDRAQCAVYPTYSVIYGNCMATASSDYAIAAVACSTNNESATLTTSGGGDNGGSNDKGKGRFDHGQFGKASGGLTVGGSGNNSGAGKPGKISFSKLGGLNTSGG